jgi:hypothetical protein
VRTLILLLLLLLLPTPPTHGVWYTAEMAGQGEYFILRLPEPNEQACEQAADTHNMYLKMYRWICVRVS